MKTLVAMLTSLLLSLSAAYADSESNSTPTCLSEKWPTLPPLSLKDCKAGTNQTLWATVPIAPVTVSPKITEWGLDPNFVEKRFRDSNFVSETINGGGNNLYGQDTFDFSWRLGSRGRRYLSWQFEDKYPVKTGMFGRRDAFFVGIVGRIEW